MSSSPADFRVLRRAVESCPLPVVRGRVVAVGQGSLRAELPGARLGARAEVRSPGGDALPVEVASGDGREVGLLPFEPADGIGVGDEVRVTGARHGVPCGGGLLGRVIDPLGRPLDGLGPVEPEESRPHDAAAPAPFERLPVEEQLITGTRIIDGCLALGVGQRIGLFAGAGLGKSTLLGSLARSADCDVAVVCLVGERGREAQEFIESRLGPAGLARSVVVLATADTQPALRARAVAAATTIAEWFRGQGRHALLLVDSLTRAVRARRDVALALGEPPARGGFPASSFAGLPALLERAGRVRGGVITAVYTVLTEGGTEDPVAEEARSLLDGHIELSPVLAGAGRWPAVDPLRSVSRVMGSVVPASQARHAAALRRMLGAHARHEDLILMGAYRRGTCADTDKALERLARIRRFLEQDAAEAANIETTRAALRSLSDDSGE